MEQDCERILTDDLEQQVLQTAARAALPHGVTCVGACALEELSTRVPCRALSRLPAAGGVVVLLLPYYTGEWGARNVARYAVCDDYHTVASVILADVCTALAQKWPWAKLLPFVDSSPVPEVEAACLAGLGTMGKGGLLLTPQWGSRVFICEVVTDLPFGKGKQLPASPCEGCSLCLDVCPTGALQTKSMDKTLCRSYITQKKGELTPWEQQEVRKGGLAWGCDLCTDACPHNRKPAMSPVMRLRQNLCPTVTEEHLQELLQTKSYGWRGSGVLTRNLRLITEDERKSD